MSHRLLCVHPHPDDEAIACGGTISRYADLGTPVHVVTCTGGEAGENLSGIELGGRGLAELRREEMADAIAALDGGTGRVTHEWLGYLDSGMVGTPENEHPDSFHQAVLEEAAGRLAAIIRRVRPHVVVSDDENGAYGHPDHIKANVTTARAVELAADPEAAVAGAAWSVAKRYVWVLSKQRAVGMHNELLKRGLASPFGEVELTTEQIPFGASEDAITTRIEILAWLARKQDAMRAHRTQIGADSFFLNMPEELAPEFFGLESFSIRAGVPVTDPTSAAAAAETDLFAGIEA